MSKSRDAIKKMYRDKIERLRLMLNRRQSWLKSEVMAKTKLDCAVARWEIVLLKKDLAEAKKMLKRRAKT